MDANSSLRAPKVAAVAGRTPSSGLRGVVRSEVSTTCCAPQSELRLPARQDEAPPALRPDPARPSAPCNPRAPPLQRIHLLAKQFGEKCLARRADISSIMVIGAGPIVIGQACEFDYSGTQAVKALGDEGYRVILVNSNPATIMTDPGLADATYIEPITPEVVARVIEREQPDALLPTMGGQTALNTARSLATTGVLARFGTELIGATLQAIDKAEDREQFRDAMQRIGLECARGVAVHTLTEARSALDAIGLPAIIRPSFTLGGTGGGIAYNREQFKDIVRRGLDASPVTEVLVEESLLGWKEYEMEVVRDRADNCIIVCSIENVDPMGVHTGDSITVAPALTLTDKEYQGHAQRLARRDSRDRC